METAPRVRRSREPRFLRRGEQLFMLRMRKPPKERFARRSVWGRIALDLIKRYRKLRKARDQARIVSLLSRRDPSYRDLAR